MIQDFQLKFLQKYINNASPSGHEHSGQQLWLEYITPYVDDYFVDIFGSVAAIINKDKKYKVVIEAHADQVSYYINFISSKGYIYVTKLGGADPVIAPSKGVNIHTSKGVVKGIFGWPATHVRKSLDKGPSLETIFIEVGCSSKQEVLNLGIDIGCPVTFDDDLKILNGNIIVGPALDNKIGGFIIAEVARKIFENGKKLPFTLYIINSVQEETGKLGAVMMGNNLHPDVAIVTDVTHDTQSPMYDKKKYGDISLGKGPVLTYAPSVQKNLLRMIQDVADKNLLSYQKKSGKSTGTDADAFAFSDHGVACALISVPIKYMHTTAETAHMEDVERVIELIYQFLIQLEEGHDFRYFK
jgi:putative aminopeptidase FrvX